MGQARYRRIPVQRLLVLVRRLLIHNRKACGHCGYLHEMSYGIYVLSASKFKMKKILTLILTRIKTILNDK